MDLRRTLFSNIVLSGGSTLFKGFGDRLLSEVKKLAPKDIKIRVSTLFLYCMLFLQEVLHNGFGKMITGTVSIKGNKVIHVIR